MARKYRIIFERKVEAFARGSIVVDGNNLDEAENNAEIALMQGDVDFTIDPKTIAYPESAYIQR